ncbi:hypothetical protein BT63DRAFT_474249 [Microthyrium microscopicum]|uniref:Zn(2)-C6 fungal-type domain-containing protein n=1 Tax=Microthyrium microscopicum TaxID=703497 RepID=A0A6A6URX3_9PEZI|nr:hypothetical protein BT63DRAFT_474249 [Microthyrium microscopicum]
MESNNIKRRRRFSKKVKTGCSVCRIRRIKCDETKPECNKCVRSGWSCSYSNCQAEESVSGSTTSPRHKRCSTRQIESLPTPERGPNLVIGTIEEQRSFHFFQTVTFIDLHGVFNLDFWPSVLQAAQRHPAIRHAASAIGAMHAKFLRDEVKGSSSPSSEDEALDEEYTFALKQCNAAIKSLMAMPENTDYLRRQEVALVSCILFMAFDSLQGDKIQAISHLRSGMTLLEDTAARFQKANNSHINEQRCQELCIDWNVLRTVFTTWDVQARLIMDAETRAGWDFGRPTQRLRIPLPLELQNIENVRAVVDDLTNKVFVLISSLVYPSNHEDKNSLLEQYRNLSQCHTRVQGILTKFKSSSSKLKSISQASLYTAEMYMLTNHIALRMCAARFDNNAQNVSRDTDYNIFTEMELSFAQVLVLAEKAMQIMERSQEKKLTTTSLSSHASSRPIFSVGLGLVQPLFNVAMNSRNNTLREKAIVMLQRHNRKEGLLDSPCAAAIARTHMEIERGQYNRLSLDIKDQSAPVTILLWETKHIGPKKIKLRFVTNRKTANDINEVIEHSVQY